MVPVKDEDNAAHACPGTAGIRHTTRIDARRVNVPRRLNVDILVLHKPARTSNTPISVSPPAMSASIKKRVRNLNRFLEKYISFSAIETISGVKPPTGATAVRS
jgi:hypothetical protein